MRDRAGILDGGVNDTRFRRVVKAPTNPDFSHLLIPSRSLLFRYSALTFNAHSIHLDPSYAREVEGYPDVLVHGPLTLTLMLTVFQNHISDASARRPVIGSIEYRNLAPLFVEQEMRICAKRKGNGERASAGAWDIWVEGPDGGLAVKGTVHILYQQ
ncbi:hot_dog superfamily domain-containing protein [Histoplasma capsulatum G186AR]|nr:hot_dog superfamily domain-containing protein [Histoplasma capsulatum]QSS72421.1 hot_dog superfamily domain-containing protein [Histoplasma capsulatum G186AR]